MASLLLLSLHASFAQSEANNPEESAQHVADKAQGLAQNEASRQARSSQLCLTQSAIDTSRRLAERFQESAVLTKEDFRHLFATLKTGLRDHAGAELVESCAKDETSELMLDGKMTNCSTALALVSLLL